jgi:hypothetical protein
LPKARRNVGTAFCVVGKAVYDLHVRKTEQFPDWAVRIDELFGAEV